MKYFADKVIFGAGIYGLYSASCLAKKNKNTKILVLEKENEAFSRASYINQSRIHRGYHYPRSVSTAQKTIDYFNRFLKDYDFSILYNFDQIYGISSDLSWTNMEQFKKFCNNLDIPCEEINPKKYFKDNVESAFLTEEYIFDAEILKNYLLSQLANYPNAEIKYNINLKNISQKDDYYEIELENDCIIQSDYVLNTTYAEINKISSLLNQDLFKIKYELCEVILCGVSENLKTTGLTLMDGPFFSVIPFGKTDYHSLTSVSFTPHKCSFDTLPAFDCQNSVSECKPDDVRNCNNCTNKPDSAWPYMSQLAKKYMKDDFKLEYKSSLFAIKPILQSSEIDDSRPTLIRTFTKNPAYITVLSGKISNIYDLEEVLYND